MIDTIAREPFAGKNMVMTLNTHYGMPRWAHDNARAHNKGDDDAGGTQIRRKSSEGCLKG